MCSIAGIYQFKSSHSVSESLLERVGQVLSHRGPDARGKWVDPSGAVGFVHNRLSIVDLSSHANQPMHYAKGRYTIVYNGEIYNYKELRAGLLQKGYVFDTESDTEVIPALYHCYGESCLSMMEGMFAFALWDHETQVLFCARDRFGEKPFFYCIDQDRFLFASEIKGLQSFGRTLEMHPDRVLNYLLFNKSYHLEDRSKTFYSGIHSLPPAHSLTIDRDGRSTCSVYWTIRQEINRDLSYAQAENTFKELLEHSVVQRIKTDVCYGSSLSGGLDSSSLFAIIEQLPFGREKEQFTFSAFFPGFDKNEQTYVRSLLRDKTNVRPYHVLPDASGLLSAMEKMLYHQEFPVEGPSVYAQYEVMKLARSKGMKIIIDGQGADEMLGGYTLFYRYHFQQMIANFKFGEFFSSRKKFLQSYDQIVQFGPKFYVEAMLPRLALWLKKQRKLFSNEYHLMQKMLTNEWKEKLKAVQLSMPYDHGKDMTDVLKSFTLGPDFENILRFSDRNSMSQSIEVRMPFLSTALVEFLFTLPPEFKINFEWTKYILRQAFAPLLPREIVWRRDKIAFETPYDQWMQYEGIRKDLLDSVTYGSGELFVPEARALMDRHYHEVSPNFLWRIWVLSKMLKINKEGMA